MIGRRGHTGGGDRSFVALAEAFLFMKERGLVETLPLKDYLAAVSVGLVDGDSLLDLAYREDSAASVDLNVVMNGSGKMVEIQGTAENGSFDREQLGLLLDLASAGIEALIKKQREALGETAVRLIDNARKEAASRAGSDAAVGSCYHNLNKVRGSKPFWYSSQISCELPDPPRCGGGSTDLCQRPEGRRSGSRRRQGRDCHGR